MSDEPGRMATLSPLAGADGPGRPPGGPRVGNGDDHNSFYVGDHVQVIAANLREWCGVKGIVTRVVDPSSGHGTEWFAVESDDMPYFAHFAASELQLLARTLAAATGEGPVVEVPPQVQLINVDEGIQAIMDYNADLTVADVLEAEPVAWEVLLVDTLVNFADDLIDVINAFTDDFFDDDETV